MFLAIFKNCKRIAFQRPKSMEEYVRKKCPCGLQGPCEGLRRGPRVMMLGSPGAALGHPSVSKLGGDQRGARRCYCLHNDSEHQP